METPRPAKKALCDDFIGTETGGNPMLNPVVLETFFQVCDLRDLRRFRLVCSSWHDLSLQRWRNEMVINIEFPVLRLHFPDRPIRRKPLIWGGTNVLYKTPSFSTKPYRKFRLIFCDFPDVPKPWDDNSEKQEETRKMMLDFWEKCGPSMEELELHTPTIKSVNTFRKVITELTPNLASLKLTNCEFGLRECGNVDAKMQPNLKSLSVSLELDCRDVIFGDREPENPIPWFDLLSCFPSLEELEWKEFHDFLSSDLINAWDKLREIREDKSERKLNIKCENINMQLFSCTPEVLRAFLEYPYFTFRSLQIEVTENIGETFLWKIPVLHDTLTTLQLRYFGPIIRSPFINIQSTLSDLNLTGEFLRDFHFLEFTPNLRSLIIICYNLDGVVEATSVSRMGSTIQLPKLLSLKIVVGTSEMKENYSVAVLSLLLKAMPNVTVLKYPLTNESFQLVCEHWKGIKEIEDLDQSGVLNNEGITGIYPDRELRLPNITNLKCLKKFKTNSNLSNSSVWKGFLESASLISLCVVLDKETSNNAFGVLFSRFGGGVSRQWSGSDDRFKQNLNDRLEQKVVKLCKDYAICYGGIH